MATSQEEKLLLPNEKLKIVLKEIIRNHGIIEYDMEISPGCKKGDCLIGKVYRINVNGRNAKNEESSIALICKFPIDTEKMRVDSFIEKTFTRESVMYQDILPEIRAFQERLHVENGFESLAECLATNTVQFEEFVVMKDLCHEKFVMMKRLARPTHAQVMLVMEELGKFHGISFALRDQRPEILEKIKRKLPELYITKNMADSLKYAMYTLLSRAIETISVRGKYREKWEHFHNNYFDILLSSVDTELAEPYATVCHGDLKNNNLLFKYEGSEATVVRLIDWQMSRFASPITDIMYFIFCCTDKPFRDLHYESMLKTYHTSLTSFITKLGSNPDKLFSSTEFKKQLTKFGIFGLLMATTAMPVLLSEAEDFADYYKDNTSLVQNDIKELYKQRLTDVLIDMVDLEYL